MGDWHLQQTTFATVNAAMINVSLLLDHHGDE